MGILLEKMPYQEICEYTGVLEKSTGTMTMYGSTATSPGSIDRQRFFNCLIDFFVKEFTNILLLTYIMVQPQKFTLGVRLNLTWQLKTILQCAKWVHFLCVPMLLPPEQDL